MKKSILLVLSLAIVVLQSCDLREREENLQKKETILNEKEQELLLKEKTLQIKEEELARKQQMMDSTLVSDTALASYKNIIGSWAVQMVCTETTCTGSAVGDSKSETWEISFQGKNVIAKARVNEELVRVYSGFIKGNTIELEEAQNGSTAPVTKIFVRLHIADESKLEGQRDIERLNEKCKIVYSITMEKK